jgi:hypothetical protein
VLRRWTWRRLESWSLAASLAFALLGASPALAQAPLNWTQNVPGNSKAIILYADDITSWSEKGSRIFLLKGSVWIEHGVVQIQVPECTIWVDETKRRHTGIYHVDAYAEGEITLNDGPNSYSGVKGHIELNTRGEIRLKAYRGKVVQAPAPADSVFLRAMAMKYNLAEEAAKRKTGAPGIQPVAASQRIAASPPVAVPSTAYTPTPIPLPPRPPAQPATTVSGPALTLPALPVAATSAPAPSKAQLGLPQ